MAAIKKPKKPKSDRGVASAVRGSVTKSSAYTSQIVSRSAKDGRFAQGVKIISERDRDGLIKLADR